MCIRICIYSCTLMHSNYTAVVKFIKVNGPWPLGLRAALRKQDCIRITWNLLLNAARFLSYGNRQAVVKEGSWSITPTRGTVLQRPVIARLVEMFPKFRGRVHKVPPWESVLSRMHFAYIHRLFEIYFNIDLPSTLKSPKRSLSFSVSSQIFRHNLTEDELWFSSLYDRRQSCLCHAIQYFLPFLLAWAIEP